MEFLKNRSQDDFEGRTIRPLRPRESVSRRGFEKTKGQNREAPDRMSGGVTHQGGKLAPSFLAPRGESVRRDVVGRSTLTHSEVHRCGGDEGARAQAAREIL